MFRAGGGGQEIWSTIITTSVFHSGGREIWSTIITTGVVNAGKPRSSARAGGLFVMLAVLMFLLTPIIVASVCLSEPRC